MFKFTHSGSENQHEIHIVMDDYGKFMDLLEIAMSMAESDKQKYADTMTSVEVPKKDVENVPCEVVEKKPVFNFNDYKAEDSVCMCCHNQEDYEKFNQYVIDSGRDGCIGHYDDKCEQDRPRCIYFFEGTNASLDYAVNKDSDLPLILYYEDFDWSGCSKENN